MTIDVVLFEPEIPQNTGNIARTCAALGRGLHLIEPLGFSLEDKYLKRAGMDYRHAIDIQRYPNLDAFFQAHPDDRYFFFSKKVSPGYHEADFKGTEQAGGAAESFLFFGAESTGLPEALNQRYPDRFYRIPMLPGTRSLNLSNAVAVVLYEAFRQNGFPGLA